MIPPLATAAPACFRTGWRCAAFSLGGNMLRLGRQVTRWTNETVPVAAKTIFLTPPAILAIVQIVHVCSPVVPVGGGVEQFHFFPAECDSIPRVFRGLLPVIGEIQVVLLGRYRSEMGGRCTRTPGGTSRSFSGSRKGTGRCRRESRLA